MNVLHVIDQLNIGGAERVAVDLTNLLHSSEKIHVDFCVLEEPSMLDEGLDVNIHVKYLYRSKNGRLRTLWRLRNLIKQYDIIHVHMRHVYKYVALSNCFLGKKIVLHNHSSFKLKLKDKLFLQYIFKPRYYIDVSSVYLKKMGRIFMNSSKLFLLENIIIPEVCLLKMNINNKFLVIGNIKRNKNQLFILNLLKNLNFNVDFYGEIQDEVYFREMQNYIKENNLEGRVEFISGISNVQPRISNYSFGLSGSKSESGPLVLLEYLAQGIPFVSYKTGAVSDSLSKDYPNMFCDSFEQNEWLNKISLIGEYTPEFCKNIFETKFSPNTYKSRCIKIYNEIVSY